jgi:hypothetical protein
LYALSVARKGIRPATVPTTGSTPTSIRVAMTKRTNASALRVDSRVILPRTVGMMRRKRIRGRGTGSQKATVEVLKGSKLLVLHT